MNVFEIQQKINEFVKHRDSAEYNQRKIRENEPRKRNYMTIREFTHFGSDTKVLCSRTRVKQLEITNNKTLVNCEKCRDILRAWGQQV